MIDSKATELSKALKKIVWEFGPRGLNGECSEDLSMPEFIALEKVSNTQDCPVQNVGLQLGFTKSGTTRIVNRLEKKGYVKKIKSHEDARICCVVITERGEEVLHSANKYYSEKLAATLARMPKELARQMTELLLFMARILSE